jgi:hypothetical protein
MGQVALSKNFQIVMDRQGATVTVQVATRSEGLSTKRSWADTAEVGVRAWIEDVRGTLDADLLGRLDESITHIVHLPVLDVDLAPTTHRIIGVTPARIAGAVFRIVGTAAEVIRGTAARGHAATHREYHCILEPGEPSS